jgi:hypothetical protein
MSWRNKKSINLIRYIKFALTHPSDATFDSTRSGRRVSALWVQVNRRKWKVVQSIGLAFSSHPQCSTDFGGHLVRPLYVAIVKYLPVTHLVTITYEVTIVFGYIGYVIWLLCPSGHGLPPPPVPPHHYRDSKKEDDQINGGLINIIWLSISQSRSVPAHLWQSCFLVVIFGCAAEIFIHVEQNCYSCLDSRWP